MKSRDELIHGYLDETLTAEEAQALNDLLKSDPKAAVHFARLSLLHDSLQQGFEAGSLPEDHREPGPVAAAPVPSRLSKLVPWAIAAAAVAALLVFSRTGEEAPATTGDAPPGELHSSGFAVLTREVDAVWTSERAPGKGDLLSAETLSLASGLAQVEFFSGVSLTVEGRAEFEILSPEEMRVTRGKVWAQVPSHALGFQIHTPQGTALDLGTEFALDLSDGSGEVHVLDGEVEWRPRDEEKTLLTTGEGLRFDKVARSPISAEPRRFTTSGQLAERLASTQRERLEAWRAHSRELREDPDLLAYFPMDQPGPWDRELRPTQSGVAPGAIVAAEQVRGRWPGKSALDFSPNGSRVRLRLPGEYRSLTFSTWARIDSLDRRFNALFLTDNYEEGEPHWQITRDGRLFFSVRLQEGINHHIYYSPVIWNHAISKRWLHLVTTFDTASRTAVHYVNGEEVSREQGPPKKRVPVIRIGNAQIGNWGLPTKDEPEFAVRNLNGRLDEFAIFTTALSPAEVRTLYLAGKP